MLLGLMLLTFVSAQAANTAKTSYVAVPDSGEYLLSSATFVPDSDGAVSIGGTNYIAVTIKQGSTTLGSFTTFTGGTALVAGTAVTVALSGGTALEFTGGTDLISIVVTKTGTGAVLKGVWTFGLVKKQADSYNV